MANFARLLGQRRTARLFGISQRRIFDWIAESEHCSKLSASASEATHQDSASASVKPPDLALPDSMTSCYPQLTKRSIRQVKNMDVETEVYNWVQSRKPLRTSSKEIRHKAIELYRAKDIHSIQCSYGWYRRWTKRFGEPHGCHDETDAQILTWILQRIDNNEEMKYSLLQDYAQGIVSAAKPGFKASTHWAHRFTKRHHVILNWEGHLQEPLPAILEAAIVTFTREIHALIETHQLDADRITVLDEIPITFSPSAKNSLQPAKIKTQGFGRSCIKNCEASVLLSVTPDGDVLPPMIVVKCANPKNLDQVYTKKGENPVVVFYSTSTEPTSNCVSKWLDLIWRKQQPIEEETEISLLIWDAYHVHECSEIKQKCEEFKILNVRFPLGTASRLQPINCILRKIFLEKVEASWCNYMKRSATDARIVAPSTSIIVDWVYDAFVEVRLLKDTIKKSFDVLPYKLLGTITKTKPIISCEI